MDPTSRRTALIGVAAGAALLLPARSRAEGGGGEDVSAVEDLMREHGVLRRILVVYRETARNLREGRSGLDVKALNEAADLFRVFGEDYHEHQLEEAHLFPVVAKAGGEAGRLVGTLKTQHDRGREITAFIRERTAGGKLATGDDASLATALDGFCRMYEAHTAYEDTIVFQAWRKALSKSALKEAGERFEAIERQTFKGDGFDLAVDRVAVIERRLGLHDLARFTAPAAP